jgi:hypothetical protein
MDRQAAKTAIEALVRAGKMALTGHAKIRDPARGKYPLTREQIQNCLLNGSITEGPAPDIKEAGGWKVTVTRFKADEKHEVAAVLIVEKRVLVITGYGWEKVTPRTRKRHADQDEDGTDE